MLDNYNRNIDYVRISVTDRCNFRCVYCMPEEGLNLIRCEDVLSYEEILRLVRLFSYNGIDKIRLTGGEPLARKDISHLIRGIKQIKGIKEVSMTTNGSLLAETAKELKEAGLDRVNISLDTFDATNFAKLTRGGSIEKVLQGVYKALEVGLTPVKINAVLTELFTFNDLDDFIKLIKELPISVRFIEFMPVGYDGIKAGPSINQLKAYLKETQGTLNPVTKSSQKGSGPAKYYSIPEAKGMFGFITPLTEHFCHKCNRVRLTADGKLKQCLLLDQEIDLKELLRNHENDAKLNIAIVNAIREKPMGHTINIDEHVCFHRRMSQIGG